MRHCGNSPSPPNKALLPTKPAHFTASILLYREVVPSGDLVERASRETAKALGGAHICHVCPRAGSSR
jgi:hypothetical protein